jgi:hypothetical protein
LTREERSGATGRVIRLDTDRSAGCLIAWLHHHAFGQFVVLRRKPTQMPPKTAKVFAICQTSKPSRQLAVMLCLPMKTRCLHAPNRWLNAVAPVSSSNSACSGTMPAAYLVERKSRAENALRSSHARIELSVSTSSDWFTGISTDRMARLQCA